MVVKKQTKYITELYTKKDYGNYMNIEEYRELENRAKDVFALIDNQPLRINVIYYAARGKLKEVAHSMILAGLLGEKVILNNFLDTFLPSSNNEDHYNYEIKREFNHIDVCLENESNFIIIENKVNDAIEQPNQIFQYVEEAKKTRKEVFLIYLNSVTREFPSEKSLNGAKGESVFKLIPENHFVVLSYMYDILPWLDKLENEFINKPEHRHLETSLFQYIDYLKMKFNKNDEFSNKMKEKIDELLNVNSMCSDVNRLPFYDKELSLLETYRDEINKVKVEIIEKLLEECKNQLQKELGNEINFEANKYDDKTGFVFSILKGKIVIVFTTTNYEPWWGIRVDEELREKVKNNLESRFSDIKTKGSSWNLWRYTKFSDIITDAKSIHDALKEIE